MTRFRKFGLAVAIAALALVLNGCGSSSDVMDEEPPPPPPTPVELAQMDLMEKQEAYAALGADATNAAMLAAQQAVVMAAQGVVDALQAANAGVNEVTAAQAMVTKYAAMVAATEMAIADEMLDADLAAAMAAAMALGADATNADRLAAAQAVVMAAKAKLAALVANDAPQSEVTAAQAVVTMYEDMVAATEMAIADAADAASLMDAKDALMMAKDEAMAATSYMDMLAAQRKVVEAAKAVAAEDGASEADMEAANADVTMYEAMIAKTEMMKPLELDGAAMKKGLKVAHTSLGADHDDDGTVTDAERVTSWLRLDPQNANTTGDVFNKDGDTTAATDDGPLFSVSVSNQKITVTTTPATPTPPGPGTRSNAPAVTPTSATAFKASTARVAPSIEGWADAMHERTYVTGGRTTHTTDDDVTVMDIATTYTNQQSTQTRFYTEHFPTGTNNQPAGVSETEASGRLDLVAGPQPQVDSSKFPSGTNEVVTYSTAPVFAGTYYGVQGKFTCGDDGAGTGCGATTSSTGAFSLTGTWRFTPDGDLADLRVPVSNTDADFLTFGYWLEELMDAETGTTSYRAGVYFPAAGSRTGDIQSAVTGSADYAGPAAGVFAKREYDPESGGDVERAGRFTADASLTADFDVGDLEITGTITNFMHDGMMIDPKWKVQMNEGNITRVGGIFVSDPTRQMDGDGSVWTGRFHGHYAADDSDTTVDETELHPTGVVGAFSNTFDNGEVLGAFGATKQ